MTEKACIAFELGDDEFTCEGEHHNVISALYILLLQDHGSLTDSVLGNVCVFWMCVCVGVHSRDIQ